jgi:hypothetical protein
MTNKIIFTNTSTLDIFYPPKSASYFIPEWYKETQPFTSGRNIDTLGNGVTAATIKKCIPFFDAITSGYIIPLPADVYVKIIDGEQKYEWASHNLISTHFHKQAEFYPNKANMKEYPKFINPWAIKTPSGYSCLFTQPFHRPSIFTILDGVVDTDTYTAPVNFPFVFNEPDFEGIIPAGTPIAQVIPFKRESWKMELGSKEQETEVKTTLAQLNSKIFDRYKSMFWQKKSYR